MRWLELSVEVDSECVDAVAEVFHRFGHGGVAIQEAFSPGPEEGYQLELKGQATVTCYLPMDEGLRERKAQILVGLKLLSMIKPMGHLREKEVEEEEWEQAWKEHFHVHRIGERFVVKPSWREHTPREGDVVIELDPGMAFGTGLHPTTRMCLLAMERYLKPGMAMLDLGTGSGILAIGAAKLGASRIMALDKDPVAVRVAESNVKANGVGKLVSVKQATLSGETGVPFLKADMTFDLVVANLTASLIEELAGHMAFSLGCGGVLITSGILYEGLDRVIARLKSAGLDTRDVLSEGDWRTVIACRAEAV